MGYDDRAPGPEDRPKLKGSRPRILIALVGALLLAGLVVYACNDGNLPPPPPAEAPPAGP